SRPFFPFWTAARYRRFLFQDDSGSVIGGKRGRSATTGACVKLGEVTEYERKRRYTPQSKRGKPESSGTAPHSNMGVLHGKRERCPPAVAAHPAASQPPRSSVG